jgi:hypothetical protein
MKNQIPDSSKKQRKFKAETLLETKIAASF